MELVLYIIFMQMDSLCDDVLYLILKWLSDPRAKMLSERSILETSVMFKYHENFIYYYKQIIYGAIIIMKNILLSISSVTRLIRVNM
jgi:hypothetical protein